MGKAVLISIQPEWSVLIARGTKTIEIRKTVPRLEPPFKCYIYSTKFKYGEILSFPPWKTGKVIGEFICDKITMSTPGYKNHVATYWELLDGSCMTADELMDYGQWKFLYGWHISDCYIYDNPMELSQLMRPCKSDIFCEVCAMHREFEDKCGNKMLTIKRAPQSWCYVKELTEDLSQ